VVNLRVLDYPTKQTRSKFLPFLQIKKWPIFQKWPKMNFKIRAAKNLKERKNKKMERNVESKAIHRSILTIFARQRGGLTKRGEP
jgi:hypothetical protein